MAGSGNRSAGSGRSAGGRITPQQFRQASQAARSKSALVKMRAAQLEGAGTMGLQIASRNRTQRLAYRQMTKGQQAGEYLRGTPTARGYMEFNSPAPGKRPTQRGYRAPRTRLV